MKASLLKKRRTVLAQRAMPRVANSAAKGAGVSRRSDRAPAGATRPQQEPEAAWSSSGETRGHPPGSSAAAIRITVVNGDLTYLADPLLIGHYRSSKLTGAEAVMDRAIGRAMSASLQRGLYPTAPGSCQIFINTRVSPDNPWQLPRPAAVIVAGLGAEGELRGSQLIETVRQAVIAWGQRLTEQTSAAPMFSLATTLIGSGGKDVTAGQAAQLIAQGVRQANEQLSGERSGGVAWPRVDHLQIIELYLDRAGEAWRSLQILATASPAQYSIAPTILEGIGRLSRPVDAGYRGADYDFISALTQKDEHQNERIVYGIDTNRARSEVRAQATQLPLIRNLIATASSHALADDEIGRSLFRLLVPVDLEPFMGSSAATIIELDQGTAGIPWEVLDTRTPGGGDSRPWAIRTKLLRKLRTTGGPPVNDASADDSVLIIGDPACDRKRYPRLPAARREAFAVAESLRAFSSATGSVPADLPTVVAHISPIDGNGPEPDMRTIINAAMGGPISSLQDGEGRGWRIIHIAGHGEPPLATGNRVDPRGVVLSDGSFLGPREIGDLRVIPELVFVNCCYLATADPDLLLAETRIDRASFASGVAEALISVGVRCVVAAGWAVDDEPARVFATEFYRALLANAPFVDAVAAARIAAHALGGNTWAAYQCYGDPDWQYRRDSTDAQRPAPVPPEREFSGIASATGLVLALETMAVKSEFQAADPAGQVQRLRYLEHTFQPHWPEHGAVAEAFGNAWAKAGHSDEAIGWYQRARTASDGGLSVVALEQLANLTVRRAWHRVEHRTASGGSEEKAARGEIAKAMKLLDTLLAVGSTLERESLYGSAYKRLALVEAAAGDEAAASRAINSMRDHYLAAEEIARARTAVADPVNLFYPAMNRIVAQLALADGTVPSAAATTAGVAAITFDALRQSMSSAPADFWSVVGQTELTMYEAVANGTLATKVTAIVEELEGHHARVQGPENWTSVYDNAQFVLLRYQTRATPEEAAAASTLLRALARIAERAIGEPARERPAARKRTRSRRPSRPK